MPDPTRSSASGSARTSAAGIPVPDAQRRPAAAALAARGDRPRRAAALAHGRRRTAATAVFIEDRDTSDLYVLDLGTDGAAPERLTTGRERHAVLGGHAAAHLARRHDRRLRPGRRRLARPRRPAACRAGSSRAAAPVWLDDAPPARLDRARDRDRAHDPHDRRRTSPTRSRGGSPATTTTSTRSATRRTRPSPPTARRSRTSSSRATTSSARRSASSTSSTGRVRALTGTPGMADTGPAWSPDGATIAYVSERSGRRELHAVGRDGDDDRQLTARRRRLQPARVAARTASGSPRCAAGATASTSCSSTRPTARSSRSRPGGTWDAPRVDRRRRPRRGLRGPRDAGRAAPDRPRRTAPHDPRAGPALGQARAPRRAGGRLVPLVRRPRDPRLPLPPARTPRRTRRSPRSSIPTAARPTPTSTTTTPRAQYFLAKGYAWLARELPRLDRLRPRLRAAQPRDLGRRRHEGLPRRGRLPRAASTGSTATASRSSAAATARTWRRSPSPTTPSTATAARWRSTATSTSSRRGRRATASASRTSSG